MRRPRGHEEFWPYLTDQEREAYQYAAKLRRWLLSRVPEHEKTMRGIELVGRRRRAEMRATKLEAAE